MTEPTRDALHAETLAYLEGHAGQHRAIADMYGDIAEEGYAPKLRAEADKLAHAAACVKRVPELEAEVERLREYEAFVAALDSGEIVQFSGWGNGDGPQKFGIRLRGADALAFGFGPTALAAYRAALDATHRGTTDE